MEESMERMYEEAQERMNAYTERHVRNKQMIDKLFEECKARGFSLSELDELRNQIDATITREINSANEKIKFE